MGKKPEPLPPVRHFFVDEAGDLTLFNARGQVIVGRTGVSRCFMVGAVELPDPPAVESALNELRQELLRDPYLKGIPSLDPTHNKTALAFHAKDDIAEVRREVFKLLPSFCPKLIVAVRRKQELAAEARLNLLLTHRKRGQDEIYDHLVRLVFRSLLHRAEENRIVFARRGKHQRDAALRAAIEKAKSDFERKWRKGFDRPTEIRSAVPSEVAGLQVVDYCLWAVQRFYERGEDRFLAAIAPHVRLVMDLDDKRRRGAGEWYQDRNPLTLEKVKPVTPN